MIQGSTGTTNITGFVWGGPSLAASQISGIRCDTASQTINILGNVTGGNGVGVSRGVFNNANNILLNVP